MKCLKCDGTLIEEKDGLKCINCGNPFPYKFERFEIGQVRLVKPSISIWENGTFWVNEAARKKYNLAKYNYVVFFFDKEKRILGLKFFEDYQKGARKIIKNRKWGCAFSGGSFLSYYEIDRKLNKHLNFIYDKKIDLFICELK